MEACAFRDEHARFEKTEAVLLGVSPDSPAKHDKFIAKHDLPFTLIADEDTAVCQAYGVWGRKKFMGREYDGVFRATFLINPKGKIQKIWPKCMSEKSAESTHRKITSVF